MRDSNHPDVISLLRDLTPALFAPQVALEEGEQREDRVKAADTILDKLDHMLYEGSSMWSAMRDTSSPEVLKARWDVCHTTAKKLRRIYSRVYGYADRSRKV